MSTELVLDDAGAYIHFYSFELPMALTVAHRQEADQDKDRREYIRAVAAQGFPAAKPDPAATQWAFRIHVRKHGSRQFDIEDVPRVFIDAFCIGMIDQDKSRHGAVGLYPDDNITFVTGLVVTGETSRDKDGCTRVEIFRRAGREEHDTIRTVDI